MEILVDPVLKKLKTFGFLITRIFLLSTLLRNVVGFFQRWFGSAQVAGIAIPITVSGRHHGGELGVVPVRVEEEYVLADHVFWTFAFAVGEGTVPDDGQDLVGWNAAVGSHGACRVVRGGCAVRSHCGGHRRYV